MYTSICGSVLSSNGISFPPPMAIWLIGLWGQCIVCSVFPNMHLHLCLHSVSTSHSSTPAFLLPSFLFLFFKKRFYLKTEQAWEANCVLLFNDKGYSHISLCISFKRSNKFPISKIWNGSSLHVVSQRALCTLFSAECLAEGIFLALIKRPLMTYQSSVESWIREQEQT
jgi:hypothetical protein